MKIINAWSVTTNKTQLGEPGDIVLIYLDSKGKRITKPVKFDWYFYTEKTKEAVDALESLGDKISSFNIGKRYIRVYIDKKFYRDRNLMDVLGELKTAGVKTFEADVGPAKRYILDKKIQIENFDKVNIMYFDIETDDTSGKIEYDNRFGKSIIKAKDRILSFAAVDRNGKEYFFTDKDEKKLLLRIKDFLWKGEVDMLVGWNSKDFDLPYLMQRMELHEIRSNYLRNILHEDMMRRVQYFYMKDPEARQSLTSYSLDFVSKYFLGKGKIEHTEKIIDLWTNHPERLKEYNIQDCRLLKELEDKLGLINLTYQMFQMCQMTAQDWSMIKAIDNFILAEANLKGVHYPTNRAYTEEWDTDIGEYLGAYVLDPVPGYYEDVYDLDFKSLYPNIIRTFNISPETYLGEFGKDSHNPMGVIHTPGAEIDGVFRGKAAYNHGEGVIPKKIAILLEEREKIRAKQKKVPKDSTEYRDLNVKQLVVKELANSIYGVIGNQFFRGFNVNMAESITATGQYLIKHLRDRYNAVGRKVIYGDTDSIFVILAGNENIDDVLADTNKYLAEHLRDQFGVRESTIQLNLDKKFDKFLIVSKKKYVGESDGKVKFTGIECIKRDNIPVASNYQRKLIDHIFDKKDSSFCELWVNEKLENIKTAEYNLTDITIHKKMSKDARSYKAKTDAKKYTAPIHVRIANDLKNNSQDKGDLTGAGSIVSYIITDGSKGLNGIHISEFGGHWDREYYWNSLVYPPMERILAVVFPEIDWDKYYIVKPKVVKEKKPKSK